MSLLSIRDLQVTYQTSAGPLPAVRGVTLSVSPGQIVGLAGESGCGKSTLASAVLRLLPVDAKVTGEVLLNNEDILKMSWGRLRAVRWSGASIVFQGAMHALNPVRRVEAQVAEPIKLHEPKVTRQELTGRVASLLERVGVPRWRAQSYPHELSGGQRQRVMIAMAMACSPELIIADEPTTALDVMVQAQVLTLLKDLVSRTKIGMLLISHDLGVLADVCDRVAVMYAGRVVEEGPGRDLFSAAAHPYAKALAGAFPIIGDMASRRAPRGLPGDPPDPRDLPSGCPFHPRCAVAIDACRTADVRLRLVPEAIGHRQAACIHVGEHAAVSTTAHAPRAGEAGLPAREVAS
jgi:peptide/nickel transport system ATP-binding protein